MTGTSHIPGDAVGTGPPRAGDETSAWRPFRTPLYRALWTAGVFSNIGFLMHEAGAVWLMTGLSTSPVLVSLMQAAASLPIFLLTLPAGAVADVVDRRRMLLFTQSWMLVVAASLAVLTYLGLTTPWTLLALTFLGGAGVAMNTPAAMSSLGEILPRSEVPRGIVLNSVSLNIARAIGPITAGVIAVRIGPWAVFALNALAFTGTITVLYRWKHETRPRALPSERFTGALAAGLRFMRHSPTLRTALVRTGLFALCASGLWSLLPLVARRELNAGATGYGALLGCVGVGALVGAGILPKLRRHIHTDGLVGGMSLILAGVAIALATLRSLPLLCVVMLAAGVAWISVYSTLSIAAGSSAPVWVKGRGLSVFVFVFQGSTFVGSLIWGFVASQWGIPLALTVAGGGLSLGLLAALLFRLDRGEGLDLSPSGTRPAPVVVKDPPLERGPVMVTVEYQIDPEQTREFAAAMHDVSGERYRDGAFFWGLFEDVAQPGRFMEFFSVESWGEHLRQHERVTIADREVERRAIAFHRGPAPPQVSHFVTEPARAGRHRGEPS